MNSLSKVALLVTLSTVVFSGFAMDDGMDFNFFNSSAEQSVETTAKVTEKTTKAIVEAVQENPGIALAVVAGTAVVGYTLKTGYSWLRNGNKATETKTVNPQANEQKPRGFTKAAGRTPVQPEASTSAKTESKPRGFAKAKANVKK